MAWGVGIMLGSLTGKTNQGGTEWDINFKAINSTGKYGMRREGGKLFLGGTGWICTETNDLLMGRDDNFMAENFLLTRRGGMV